MFTRSRQLIQMISNMGNREFVEVPGYLYFYEPFASELFVHHRVHAVGFGQIDSYKLLREWKVSDPTTGLGMLGPCFSKTRTAAVKLMAEKLKGILMSEWNEARLRGLAEAPEHVARYAFYGITNPPVEILSASRQHEEGRLHCRSASTGVQTARY